VQTASLNETITKNLERLAARVSGNRHLPVAAMAPPTQLDYLASHAPEMPDWFKSEHYEPTPVPVPESCQRAYDASERHRKEFNTGPAGDAAWIERRDLSVQIVNNLHRIASDDEKRYALACKKAHFIDVMKLNAKWRYWWAMQQLPVISAAVSEATKDGQS
jgi:hypothetical protein